MATNYPSGLDSLSNPAGSDALSTGHASQHANANDAIEAIEGELGLNPRGGSATVKARFDAIEANSWVTSARIADGTITGTDIASGTVTSTNILDGTIVNADVNASAAIDISKISGGVASALVGNLLTANNASFETGAATGWASATHTIATSTAQAADGTYSLAMTATTTGSGYAYMTAAAQSLPVTPGKTYTFSVALRSDQASGELAQLQISWKNSGWVTQAQSVVSSLPISSAGWTTYLVTGVAPVGVGVTQATILVYRLSGANGAVTYIDKVGFWEGAGGLWALPGTPIANLGTYTDETVGRRIFTWDTVNSRWQMTYGDTGFRDVSASLSAANGFTGGSLYLRRVGGMVQLSALSLTRAAGGAGEFLAIPTGFRATVALYGRTYANNSWFASSASAYVTMAGTSDSGLSATYFTTDSWPASLPGSASGSIPT